MSLLQEIEKFGLADCEANRPFFGPSTSDAHLLAQALADNRAFNAGLIRAQLSAKLTRADALLHDAALNVRDNESAQAWADINQARGVLTEILGGL
jgi:hypothetical protein